MKFNLTGDQWLDPSTFRVMPQLNNAGNIGAPGGSPLKQIEPLSWNPAVFFHRARVICGGVVVEDIGNFNRLSLMLTALKTEGTKSHCLRRAWEGFCNFDYQHATEQRNYSRSAYRLEDYDKSGLVGVSRRVSFETYFWIFQPR